MQGFIRHFFQQDYVQQSGNRRHRLSTKIGALFGLCIVLAVLVFQGVSAKKTAAAEGGHQAQGGVEVILTPVEDTWIGQNDQTPHATDPQLRLALNTQGEETAALLRFDLSTIPQEATIQSATLQLYQRSGTPANVPWTIQVATVYSAWDATTVTWAAQPQSNCCVDEVETTGGAGQRYAWDVKFLVELWLVGQLENHGLLIQGDPLIEEELERRFDSSEGNEPPHLIIEYDVPGVTMTATSTIPPTQTATRTPTAQLLTATATSSATPSATSTVVNQPTRTATNTVTSTPTATSTVETADPLRFVDSAETPLAGATVWIFCYGAGDLYGNHLLSEHKILLDVQGMLTEALPPTCERIAASHVVHTQPSGKPGHGPAYWVLAASWRTGSGTPLYDQPCWYDDPNCPITRGPNEDITLRNDWPVILFNVVTALEWEPDEVYLADYNVGLQNAALYLADLTDGYMTFGDVAVYTGGEQWDSADIRIHVANDWNPAAFVGGIVPQPIEYTPGLGGEDPTFRPAAIHLGRAWDGDEAHRGGWNEPAGYRTLVHEWAHYALFLYDEYQQFGLSGMDKAYCVCNDIEQLATAPTTPVCGGMLPANAASAMAYQYTASELWHKDTHDAPASCTLSAQYRVHKADDWGTLAKWFQIQGVPGVAPIVIPDAPVADPSLPLGVASPFSASGAGPDITGWGPLGVFFGRSPEIEFTSTPTPTSTSTAAATSTPTSTLTSTPTSTATRSPSTIYLPDIHGAEQTLNSAAETGQHRAAAPAQDVDFTVIGTGAVSTETAASQVYQLRNLEEVTGATFRHQGTLLAPPANGDTYGEMALWDVAASDTIITYVDQYATRSVGGNRFIATSNGIDGSVQLEPASWRVSVDLVYTMTTVSAEELGALSMMEVIVYSDDPATSPTATICTPDTARLCASKTMVDHGEQKVWSARFTAVELGNPNESGALPLYGILHVVDPNNGTVTRWFRDNGGVGTGHMVGTTPQRDGRVMVDTVEVPERFMPDYCNRVLVMPALNHKALNVPIADTDYVLVGAPLDLDILFGVNEQVCESATQLTENRRLPRDVEVRITMHYSEEIITRFGIDDELQLQIYHFDGAAWDPINNLPVVDTTLNLVSATTVEDGIYAIVWEKR